MRAGSELDALVAEKVMGWERRPTIHGYEGWWLGAKKDGWHWSVAGQTRDDRGEWMPSTNITCAWWVVYKLTKTTKQWFTLEQYSAGATAKFAIVGAGDSDCEFEADETTAPHAICLAALKAVGAAVS